MPTKSVYCIETVWYGRKDRISMRPILQTMEEFYGTSYVHRDAATKSEFINYINKWINIDDDPKDKLKYPILYMGFHGKEGEIQFEKKNGKKHPGRVHELEKVLDGCCENRLVHFSSCKTLKNKRDRKIFLKNTKASAVSGFTNNVDWMECASFELLYMSKLQEYTDPKLSPKVAKCVYDELNKDPMKELTRHLGFFMEIAS